MNADSIKIETDEDGFWLAVESQNPMNITGYRFRISDPEALYDHVKAAIGPWLYERDHAKKVYGPGTHVIIAERPCDESGYDTSDPKHPAFHSTHADIWDKREGK